MLRSLPVGDPARLYRIGDGDSCCVQGGPQDRWGMFSFPLFERLSAELPEFEALTAFQAGGARVSVRRQDADTTARPLRSEFVQVKGQTFVAFGLGSMISRATAAGNFPLLCAAIVTMALFVVMVNRFFWKRLYRLAESRYSLNA